MDPPVILPPSIDDVPPPGVAIAVELDKLLMVQLRDGRKILGTLRSFDQFSNLLLESARERIIVGTQFSEIPLGLYVIRGENVVLFGDVDEANDPPACLTRVSEAEIRRALKGEKEAETMKGTLLARFDFLDDN